MGKLLSTFTLWARDPKFKNGIKLDIEDPDKVIEWCEKNLDGEFGFKQVSWRAGALSRGWQIVVKTEEDAMAFKLRWL